MRFFQRLPWVFLAAIFPIAAALFFKMPRVVLGGFSDAVFYLAYARHFGELVLRYGFPYYATRFGGILPDYLSGQVFGEVTGIWVFRYALSAAVSLALCLFFKKRYGLLAGLFASIFWSFHPAALRLICTTYVDSTSVPFLILGSVFFISACRGEVGAVLSGVLFGLAASAHLYAAFALALLFPFLIASRWGDWKGLLKSLSWMGVGFLGTFALGWIWYWAIWGMPSLLEPTREVMRDLSSGQAALWKKPLEMALGESPAWFAPILLTPAVVFAAWRGSPLMRGAAASLLASICFFWGGDLFGNAYVLSMPFYYSFLLPVTVLSAATMGGELFFSQRREEVRFLLFAVISMMAVAPAELAFLRQLSPLHELWMLITALLALGCVFGLLQNRSLSILATMAVGAASFCVAFTGMFSWMLGNYPMNDVPVLELAAALQKEVPAAHGDPKVTRFWYDDDGRTTAGLDRKMIGSFWLHTFGRLTGKKEGFVPFLTLNDADAEVISLSGVDRIVIFDQDQKHVELALKEIEEKKLPFQISRRTRLCAPSDSTRSLEVAVLERKFPERKPVSPPLDLQTVTMSGSAKIIRNEDHTVRISGNRKWMEFAKLRIGPMKKGEELWVDCKVMQGMVRFALNDVSGDIVMHVEKWPTQGDQMVVLRAPTDLPDAFMTLHSMYPNGSWSRVTLKKAEIEERQSSL